MAEILLTAFDLNNYLREALPALRAAIYRGDLSQAKDVLLIHDDTIYDEYDLSLALVENDYSWIFTDKAANPEELDPEGTLVGLTYPLILAYHQPDLFRVKLGGSELTKLFPFFPSATAQRPIGPTESAVNIQPGFREGLRTMWEIMGYLTPESTEALRQYCLKLRGERADLPPNGTVRLLDQIASGLKVVVERGFGLVIERD